MSRLYKIMSPVHNFIILCAFMAAMGFGMLVAFNKRVAEEKSTSLMVTLGSVMTLEQLTAVRVTDL